MIYPANVNCCCARCGSLLEITLAGMLTFQLFIRVDQALLMASGRSSFGSQLSLEVNHFWELPPILAGTCEVFASTEFKKRDLDWNILMTWG